MNPLNIHRDIHNSLLISFYLDLIPVSLISVPYPYSFLTLSILLYDLVYIFYCYTFVVRCCYLLVSAVKCGYSYIVHLQYPVSKHGGMEDQIKVAPASCIIGQGACLARPPIKCRPPPADKLDSRTTKCFWIHP